MDDEVSVASDGRSEVRIVGHIESVVAGVERGGVCGLIRDRAQTVVLS